MNLVNKIKDWKIDLKIPVIGTGCGVLGLSMSKVSLNIGKYASELLKALEYRGYDSTGAIFQKKKKTTLLKDVGAPSKLVKTLGIEDEEGKIFCGQVRWATFGAVDKENAQPHEVKCKTHIYGAHNGNIVNTDELKKFLINQGHRVVSDNDGEMLVHMVEHYFDIELDKISKKEDTEKRKKAMRKAIIKASKEVVGSYAAVIVDPVTEVSYAIKSGSSLYFGVGEIESQKFSLVSSDLTAILRFTKNLVELREGDFIEYTSDSFNIFAFKDYKIKQLNKPNINLSEGENIKRKVVRSKLRAEDTELLPEFDYFMEQEINAEIDSTGKLIKMFRNGSNTARYMSELIDSLDIKKEIMAFTKDIEAERSFSKKRKIFDKFSSSKIADKLYEYIKTKYYKIYKVAITENFQKRYFFSDEKNTYLELIGEDFDEKRLLIAKILDTYQEKINVQDFNKDVESFINVIENTKKKERNIYMIACGTSYNACKTATIFFNEIAGTEIIAMLPGEYRGQYSNCIKDNDVIIGVSQSGETKDLVDIFNDIDESGLDVKKIVLVNNQNSTLGQEKSDVSISIFCGPEIAVPATKSFINQLTMFYYLSIKLKERKLGQENIPKEEKKVLITQLNRRFKTLYDIPQLIEETIKMTKDKIEKLASNIYLAPSIHILATKILGVANEGALKIRETVLNHTEGKEASEFKHGPNTILGKNTVFGLKNVQSMIKYFNSALEKIEDFKVDENLSQVEVKDITKALTNFIFTRTIPFQLSEKSTNVFRKIVDGFDFIEPLFSNYPLIYVTGPSDRDVNLTISQINTHKIRGANSYVIAEENDKLLQNCKKTPAGMEDYDWEYITLPTTNDTMMTTFSSTIVLQLLALEMSIKKKDYCEKLNIVDHGVHPDVPKNVSKSITVD